MTTTTTTGPGAHTLGLSLLVIATAQLMLVLDDSIATLSSPGHGSLYSGHRSGDCRLADHRSQRRGFSVG